MLSIARIPNPNMAALARALCQSKAAPLRGLLGNARAPITNASPCR
jgi:hypothetical protein